jgi:hypothetical protein
VVRASASEAPRAAETGRGTHSGENSEEGSPSASASVPSSSRRALLSGVLSSVSVSAAAATLAARPLPALAAEAAATVVESAASTAAAAPVAVPNAFQLLSDPYLPKMISLTRDQRRRQGVEGLLPPGEGPRYRELVRHKKTKKKKSLTIFDPSPALSLFNPQKNSPSNPV